MDDPALLRLVLSSTRYNSLSREHGVSLHDHVGEYGKLMLFKLKPRISFVLIQALSLRNENLAVTFLKSI